VLQANTNAGAAITALSNGFFVDPVRTVTNANSNATTSGNILFYNSSTKEVSTQSIPAFSATGSGNTVISVAFTLTPVAYATEILDTDNWFANNRYTPQRPGWYQISCSARMAVAGAGTGNEASASLRKNGTSIAIQGGWGAVTGAMSQLVQFNGTTDYVDVAIVNAVTGNVVQSATQTTFNGFWVRP
jgi:hypothetical protein